MKLEVDLSKEVEIKLTEIASKVWSETFRKELEKQAYPEYMTLAQTCDYLNISRGTLNEFIKNGLEVSKINQTKRISKTDAMQFMEENKL